MTGRPWFRLNAENWLTSGAIAAMSAEERGIYITFLCYAWTNPSCSLPSDNESLRKIAHIDQDGWNRSSKSVLAMFTPHPHSPGLITNARLAKEREHDPSEKKKKPPVREENPSVAEIRTHYESEHQRIHGRAVVFDSGSTRSAIARALRMGYNAGKTSEDWIRILKVSISDFLNDRDYWLTRFGHPLTIWAKRLNAYIRLEERTTESPFATARQEWADSQALELSRISEENESFYKTHPRVKCLVEKAQARGVMFDHEEFNRLRKLDEKELTINA